MFRGIQRRGRKRQPRHKTTVPGTGGPHWASRAKAAKMAETASVRLPTANSMNANN